MVDQTKLLLMGRIGAAHGIRGEVRITPFTAEPLALADYRDFTTQRSGQSIRVLSARLQKNVLVARLEGVSDRNAAERLNGTDLYVERDRLPAHDDEDDFYHADLVGLEARLGDGHILGTVSAVPNFGAGDLIEVTGRDGESFLFPFTKAIVPVIAIEAGYIEISPPLDADPGEEEPD